MLARPIGMALKKMSARTITARCFDRARVDELTAILGVSEMMLDDARDLDRTEAAGRRSPSGYRLPASVSG